MACQRFVLDAVKMSAKCHWNAHIAGMLISTRVSDESIIPGIGYLSSDRCTRPMPAAGRAKPCGIAGLVVEFGKDGLNVEGHVIWHELI